ncbi:bifunctional alpha/beta hydrolase/OsmC family protein [Oricola thermophila]|uniref:Alpha/beta fold hydrolase n=1 Tax=Oricola thermophila TaxID=2742145 RepID=A0A6N1VCL4_9HYPH|nr:bifunctional alpha/beta hydrolase/OsmC family protein [Oricola thermophila]QKV18614.1 alpha/beta fold hydrolase [Oricola thermophila]
MATERLEFPSATGEMLAARLDLPDGVLRGCALFAHCFTCTKDILAARRIAGNLARLGIAVLRFDFTGLGSSEGEFANTSFRSNVADLVAAANYMRERLEAPSLLVGHSLGGAAVLVAAHEIPEVKGVVTIGAPADAEHVLRSFHADIETIERDGEAEVTLSGRKFRIGKEFVEAARSVNLLDRLPKLRASLLIMHSPLDAVVGIDNAERIFTAARHPKSYISLDQADHLLTRPEDADFAASVIAGWATRFLPKDQPQGEKKVENVRVSETRQSKFQNTVQAGVHRFFADEPASVGGTDSGPSPYDLLSAALGACTSMTLRMYADFKKVSLGAVTVEVSHAKVHASDCAECSEEERTNGGKIDRFERRISVDGEVAPELADKLAEIAGKCPVHRTLEGNSKVVTVVEAAGGQA